VTRLARLHREAAVSAAAAASLGATLVWLGPPAGDLAAHSYLRSLFLHHGFTLWDNLWYAGRFTFLSYSVLYYPLSAVLGIKLLAVTTVAGAAFAFAGVLERQWGGAGRASSRVFALVWAGVALVGIYPFALGAMFALFAIWTLQARRGAAFGVLALLTLASSPLAFLLLALVCTGVWLGHRPPWRNAARPGLVLLAVAAIAVVLWRLFPAGGRYPFSVPELLAACAFFGAGTLLTWRVERARALRGVFAVNLVACLAAFAVPSALGENVTRLRLAAVPLAVLTLSLRRWRPRGVAVVALLLAAAWNASPIAANFVQGQQDRSASRAFWAPAIRFLHAHADPSYRVEVVDTVDHWEAVYLPRAGIPIARGWFRQDDLPFNAVLYRRRLSAGSYVSWLRGVGVRWVVLTTAPLDYSARAEAALLESGRSGLTPVFRSGTTTIFAVSSPRRIVTGPGDARIVALKEARIVVAVGRPGVYRIAVRFAPYWHSSAGCVTRSRDGMLSLSMPRSGLTSVSFDLDPGTALAALEGAPPPRCP
jgi:hypothetical protein